MTLEAQRSGNLAAGGGWLALVIQWRMVIVLALLIAAASLLTEDFARRENLLNVARQVAPEALIGFGMTLVIITGGIDLSVGSLVALTGVMAALVMRATLEWSGPLCVIVGVGAGITAGACSGGVVGSVVTRFSIPPFIVTLAAMLIARGLAFIACGGEPIYELPAELRFLGRGFVAGVLPVPVLIMLIGFVIFHVLLTRTVFGRCVIAVGSNEEAARLAGIPVRRVKFMVYVITGALCGLVGTMQSGKLMSADARSGEMWELNVIAAVVVGGTSLFGGRGSITGTLIGALIIGVLLNSLNLLHVQHFWQKVVIGVVIILAALLDAGISRLGRK
ncbi:MAG: ABC transporter permease [Planctomycetota bacterium]|jgi:ribose transport system permease protein